MKRIVIVTAMVLAAASVQAADQKALETEQDKLSYTLGMDLGGYLKTMDVELNLDVFHQGLVATYSGQKPLLTPEQAAEIKQAFAQKQQEKQAKEIENVAKANKEATATFLAENKKKKGVTVTASGLQYEVIKAGEGATPKAEDQVTVHYKGTLLDGSEFDSSYKRNQPATFHLNQVIPGWTEGLQLMKPGATYKLYIPSELGYGDRGMPPMIGPGSMLIFEVELVAVKAAPEATPKAAPQTK